MSIEKLGQDAYNKIMSANYRGALAVLNSALLSYPEDSRLYSNRCFCHLEMGDYRSARCDAMTLINKYPNDRNGYFLLGEVLLSMKLYKDAECEFHRAYQLDPIEFIADRLFEAQMSQILEKCNDLHLARRALLTTQCVQEALSDIERHQVPPTECVQSPTITFSTDELQHLETELLPTKKCLQTISQPSLMPVRKGPQTEALQPLKKKDCYTDPSNPLKANTIWVGNVPKDCKENRLRKHFSKAGKVENACVKINKSNGYAFVTFKDWTAAAKAMQTLQGSLFDSKALNLRFRDMSGR